MRILTLLFVIAGLLPASDWDRFRGPNGTGVSPERGLPADLGPDRNVVWKLKTPKGNSSPIVAGGRIYFTGHEGDDRIVLCYDAESGRQLWRRAVPKLRSEAVNPMNGPTTPTPATDGRSLFVFFPDIGLLAFDLDGNERWRVPLGPFGAVQGMAVSPVYVAGKVVLLVDTPELAYLAAYDARTGKQAWKVERPIGFLGSYSTPALDERNGKAQLVVAGAVELTAYAPESGERVWWARGVLGAPAAPPLVSGDSVYTLEPAGDAAPPFDGMLKQLDRDKNGKIELPEAAGESLNAKIMYRIFQSVDKNTGNNDGAVTAEEWSRAFSADRMGGGLVRTRLGGKGDVSAKNIVWRQAKSMPYVTAPVLHDGVLYVVRNGGIVSTFDAESGKLLGEQRLKDAIGDYYASPVAADGKIYFVSKDGKISVVRPGTNWEVISSGDLDEQVIATPAIANGHIYIRTDQTLYCFGATTPKAEQALR